MLVLGILITGGLAVATSYSNRSLDQHVNKQSYYTALSTTKAIAEWLSGTTNVDSNSSSEQLRFINGLLSSEGEHSTSFDSTIENSLGTCNTTVSIDPDTQDITIASTASYNDGSSTVSARLSYTEGQSGGDGGKGSYTVISTPEKTPTKTEIETPISGTLSEEDGGFNIRRNVEIDLNDSNSFLLENNISPDAHPNWISQFYSINTFNGNINENYFIKLANGTTNGFPAVDNSEEQKLQDRNMLVYGRSSELGGKYNSLTIYTDESDEEAQEPPRKHIFMAPHIIDRISTISKQPVFNFNGTTGFEYKNTHIQINDDGVNSDGEKYKLLLPCGVIFDENSTIYTRRDTLIGLFLLHGWGGLWYAPDAEGEYSHCVLKENDPGNPLRQSVYSPKDTATNSLYSKTVIRGTLIVAGNTTHIYAGSRIEGDIIVEGTAAGNGIVTMSNGAYINGGNIYVKDGGILRMTSWNMHTYDDIFVEPGGTLEVSNNQNYHNNIYLLPGVNEDGEHAKMIVSGSITGHSPQMDLLGSDEKVLGGIHVGEGAELTRKSGGIYETWTIHAEAGSNVTGYTETYFCDNKVHGKKPAGKVCYCGVSVPEYGNDTSAWRIKEYYED